MDKLSLKWEGKEIVGSKVGSQMGEKQNGMRWPIQDQVQTEGGMADRAAVPQTSVYVPEHIIYTFAYTLAMLQGPCKRLIIALRSLRAFRNLPNIFPDIISFHCHSHSVGLAWLLLFCKWRNQASERLSKSHAVQKRKSWVQTFPFKSWVHAASV